MGRKAIDYTGYRIGRLTVTGKCPWRSDAWLCDCSCGTKGHIVSKNNIKKTFSCGCLRNERTSERMPSINKKRASKKEAIKNKPNLIIEKKEGFVNE